MSIFHTIFPLKPFYEKQLIAFQNVPEQTIFVQPAEKIFLSVIYQVPDTGIMLEKQLGYFAHHLQKALSTWEKFEIIVLLEKEQTSMLAYIEKLSQKYPNVFRCFYAKPGNFTKFLIGGIRARGKIVIDQSYVGLVDTLPRHQLSFVKFFYPRVSKQPPFYNHNNYLIPVAASKDVITNVFSQLHLTEYGSSAEILELCSRYGLEAEIDSSRIRKKVYFFDAIARCFEKPIVKFLYRINYWHVKLD